MSTESKFERGNNVILKLSEVHPLHGAGGQVKEVRRENDGTVIVVALASGGEFEAWESEVEFLR